MVTSEFPELEEYIGNLERRGRKDTTLDNYRGHIARMLRILREDGYGWHSYDIGEDEVMHLYKVLPLSESSCRLYLKELGFMIKYHTGRNPVETVGILWNRREVRRTYITKEELATIYRAADPTDRMVLVLGAYLGLRRAEISTIRDGDIKDGRILIHGKGHGSQGKIDILDIPMQVQRELDVYNRWKSQYDRKDDYVIQALRGHTLRRVKPDTISSWLLELSEKVGIEFTAHALRRLYATTLYYDVKADLNAIRRMMRHNEVETTINYYIRPYPEIERSAQRAMGEVLDSALGIL